MADELTYLEVNQLQPNPLQSRGIITQTSLNDLVESIKEHGVLEPLVVARTPAGYQLIAGERRWRAARIAGVEKVPVVIKETTSQGMLELAIVENVQREDLNPIERAQAFKRLLDEFSLQVSAIAKRIGKSDGYVSNTLRLLTLPDAIKDGLISSAITEGHARALAGIGDTRLMIEAYKILLAENSSVRRAEDLARKMKSQLQQETKSSVAWIHSELGEKISKNLESIFNGKVRFNQSNSYTRLTILIKGPPERIADQLDKFTSKLTP
jgi:ParB family chromosome partitioning protein